MAAQKCKNATATTTTTTKKKAELFGIFECLLINPKPN